LNITKEFGTVRKNEKFSLDLEFAPHDEFAFKANASLSLSIISGPTYNFVLRGTAKKPGVDFSFFHYDFGPCFVLKQPLPITAFLEVRNRENTAMTIESLF
jgi:hydrocephalus-inducing protein